MRVTSHVMRSPLGQLLLIADTSALTGLYFYDDASDGVLGALEGGWRRQDEHHELLLETRRQLGEYFGGVRSTFELPVRTGGTAFQRRLWRQVRSIPFGKTTTYSDLARRWPEAAPLRRIEMAALDTPIGIVIPIHRVIGSCGELGRWPGGVARKRWLLEHEQRILSSHSRKGKARSVL